MSLFPNLYKRGNVYWFAQQVAGKRKFFSLKTGDPEEAVRKAAKLRGVPLNTGEATVAELIEPFMEHKQSLGRYTDASVNSKSAILSKFAETCATPASKISSETIKTFYKTLREEGLADDTVVSYLGTLRAFFRWCIEVKKIRLDNPCAGLHLPRISGRARRDFCKPELVEKLIAECPREDLKFVLFCGFHAGMRKNEIIEAKAFWFDLDNQQIHMRKHDGIQFKDREERSLPMTEQFAEFLKGYGMREPYMLHPEVQKGRSLYRYDFEHYFKAYMEKQGVPWLTTHIMRHTFASLLASARGADGGPANSIFEIAVWLGDDVRVVQKHYAKLLPLKRDVGSAFRSRLPVVAPPSQSDPKAAAVNSGGKS